ncbi:MAG TPA: hypothetical protein VHQ42_05650 [Candidatus Limnocylindria bacterium]|nr:hypothetical protein [Candidatus Limnocylindria bacterium]
MTWFRGRGAEPTPESLEALERELELAAAEAPPSPRVDQTRVRLLASLEEADGGGRPVPGAVLAAVVVLLLALVVAVGAPAVGSYLEDVFDETSPAPVVPSPSQDSTSRDGAEDLARVPRVRTDAPAPSPSAVADAPAVGRSSESGGSVTGAARPVGATPVPTPVPPPTPTPVPWPPADPPVDVPMPPVTPPVPPSLP